jgi:hypothetical protein
MSKLLTTFLLIHQTISILLSMDGHKKHCLSKPINEDDSLHFSFVVTGDDHNERTRVLLTDPDSQTIYQKENTEEGEYKAEIKKPGVYKVCFFPSSGKAHFISFEFYSLFERGHILNLAKDGKH